MNESVSGNNLGFAIYQHFIITRFNIPIPNWTKSKHGEDVTSAEWLRHRFDLFENYCFPSLKNQNNKNFSWYVFFDTKTPAHYRARITEMTKTLQNFKPVFVDGHEQFMQVLKDSIIAKLKSSTTHIITTRLDNDDGIAKTFVAEVQAQAVPGDLTVIDIVDGYQLAIDSSLRLSRYGFNFNPFVSIVEPVSDFSTVMSRRHGDWQKLGHLITVKQKRLWVQVIHKANLLNTYYPGRLVSLAVLREQFGVSQQVIDSFKKVSPVRGTLELGRSLIMRAAIQLRRIGRRLIGRV